MAPFRPPWHAGDVRVAFERLSREFLEKMITAPTVFIVGAGANVHLGFPVGKVLLQKTCDLLTERSESGIGDPKALYTLRCVRPTVRDIEQFRHDLAASFSPSVDAFLELRPEFSDLGKAAMASVLLPSEADSDHLVRDPSTPSWLKYVFHRMRTDADSFCDNQVSFVTFNYDRSLEHLLCRALKGTYGMADAQAANLVATIPIVHPHGQLGRLPWQDPDGHVPGPSVPYGAKPGDQVLTQCVESIRIIHEADRDLGEMQRAQQLLQQASRIYFLGFGYHNDNVARLNPGHWRRATHVAGTAYNMETQERITVQRTFAACGVEQEVELGGSKMDCLDWLREYAGLS